MAGAGPAPCPNQGPPSPRPGGMKLDVVPSSRPRRVWGEAEGTVRPSCWPVARQCGAGLGG